MLIGNNNLMKILLALLLLIPSLSFGNELGYLKKQINYIYKDLNSKQIDSYDAYFYVEQLSDAFEPWMLPWETCYKELVKNTSNEVYDKLNACILYRTSFGYTYEEFISNLEKFSFILNVMSELQQSGQFYLDKSDIDKFNENSANITKAVTLLGKVQNITAQIQD